MAAVVGVTGATVAPEECQAYRPALRGGPAFAVNAGRVML